MLVTTIGLRLQECGSIATETLLTLSRFTGHNKVTQEAAQATG